MFRELLDRLRGRRTIRHTTKHEFKVKLTVPQGEDPQAVAKEIEAEIERELAAGTDPAAAQAVLDEIAQRHGGKLDKYKQD